MDIRTKDGILLRNVPDGTPDEEIKARIEKIRAEGNSAKPARQLQPPEPMSKFETLLANFPEKITLPGTGIDVSRQGLTDFAAGASSLMRGGANLISKGAGDAAFPTEAANKSPMRTAGELLDPVGLAIGGGVGKVLPYAPVFGNGLKEGLKATAKNAAGGAAVGAGVGALSEDGTAAGGAATGAGIMAALPVAAKAVAAPFKFGYSVAEPWLPGGGYDILKRFVTENAGGSKDKIIAALENAKELVKGSRPTAGEALADVPEATRLAAHQMGVSKAEGSPLFQARKAEQEGARRAALGEIAQTPETLAAAVQARAKNASEQYGAIKDQRLDPRSEAQIWSDKVRGAEGRTKASADADFYPVPGQPKLPGTYSAEFERNAQHEEQFKNALQALRETMGVDNNSLRSLLDRPSMQDALREAMNSSLERGHYFPSKQGDKFSIENLQRMKMALDDALNRPGEKALDKAVAQEVSGTRGSFIDWLGSRSPEWKKARLNFAEDSKPINQMQVGQYLEEKLGNAMEKETPGIFSQAVRDAPGTIKRSGSGRSFDKLAEVLTPQQEGVVNAIQADLVRKGKYEQLARGSNLSGTDIEHGANGVRLPNMLSRPAMIVNYILSRGKEGVNKKINQIAAETYLDPEKLAVMLRDVPQTKERQVIEALIKAGRYPALGSAVEGMQ